MSWGKQVEGLTSFGFRPLPVKAGEKHPYIKWTDWRDKPTWPALASEFRPNRGVWSILGAIVGWIVLDLDNDEAATLWAERLGSMWDQVPAVRTRKGWHLYFRVATDQPWPGWTWQTDPESVEAGAHWEVLGDGQGVMMPPSQHPDDPTIAYEWEREPWPKSPYAPAWLRRPTEAPGSVSGASSAISAPRSMLAALLESPPTEGGRNVWLAKVAGHMAKHFPFPDAYQAVMHTVNQALPEPLDDTEVNKTIESIWTKEQNKPPAIEPAIEAAEMGSPDEANGYLVGDGQRLWCPIKDEGIGPWSDFDIRVLGRIVQHNGQDLWRLEIRRTHDQPWVGDISARVLADKNEMVKWLGSIGCTIMPDQDLHQRTNPGSRLVRYIKSQKAPVLRQVDSLGWHDEAQGFVSHEGVIKATGLEPFAGWVPAQSLRKWSNHHYGFAGTQEEAIAVLRQVLTYHDPQVCAVFGSWWAATLLKGQIMQQTSMFPFMAIEAPSESGKTQGYFSLMLQLAGTRTAAQMTVASMRDALSAHRSGIVWIDDMSDTARIEELLRHATTEGEMSKKGQDRTETETVRLVGTAVVSAESLAALHQQKALIDRSVLMNAGSPTARMSQIDPTRPQWDDILALRDAWGGDLTQISGHLVQAALGLAPIVDRLKRLRPNKGRHGDKLAVVRVGALVLAEMVGEQWIVDECEKWVQQQALGYNESANSLTLQILPECIVWYGAALPTGFKGGSPVVLDERGRLYYSEESLAAWYQNKHRGDARAQQMSSAAHLHHQGDLMGMGEPLRKDVSDLRGVRRQMRYRRVPTDIAERVTQAAGLCAAVPGTLGTSRHNTDNGTLALEASYDK